jgi:hypothetical protein
MPHSHSRKSSAVNGHNAVAIKNGVAVPTQAKNPKLFSIIDFLGQCSRFELDWLIEESSKYLAALLQDASVQEAELATYECNFSPANIHVERARRQIGLPPHTRSKSIESAASFLAGFIIECSNDDAFTNKASRMRSKIGAVTALKGIHFRLRRSATDKEFRVLALVRRLQESFISQHASLPKGKVTMEPTRSRSESFPPDFLPLRPTNAATYMSTLPEAIVVTRPPRHEAKFAEGPLSTLVIPSAGRSSRFPGHKPKWLLTMPNGRLMVVDALANLNLSKVKRVVLGVLKEHVDKHCKSDISALIQAFEDGPAHLSAIELSIVVISQETVDQVQTIECILKAANVTGPIYLKDCDNQFECDVPGVDGIATLEITKELQNLNIPAGKSYAAPDSNGNIDNIVEKVILGPHFCVGGYSFSSAQDFIQHVTTARYYQTITSAGKIELAVSDVVWLKLITSYCLRDFDSSDNVIAEFVSIPVSEYEDWGTLQAWEAYARTFRTLFLDIDGTLIKNSGGYFKPIWGMQPPLNKSVEHLQHLKKKGRTQIILTTSRPESFREVTIKQLEEHGVPYDQIVFGMFHAQRVVVNDFAKTNPFPSAAAINLRRDGDELPEMLGFY